jgi:TetR/AcrR family transcriptional repressor of nem operon
MSTAPSRKEATHERIVSTAARIIRRSGYDGVGVADIMKEAGLTHGGFYAHFPSKTALLAEAADHACDEGVGRLHKLTEAVPAEDALDTIIDYYLSDAHVATQEHGCSLAALASEVPRQEPEIRRAATRNIKKMLEVVEGHMPGEKKARRRREKAMAALGSLVGTLILARAVEDEELSTSLRDATKKLLRGYLNER